MKTDSTDICLVIRIAYTRVSTRRSAIHVIVITLKNSRQVLLTIFLTCMQYMTARIFIFSDRVQTRAAVTHDSWYIADIASSKIHL